jgi:hypothetical protein
MRQTLGTAVFSGMLGVTLFGIFLTPVFYFVIQWISDKRSERRDALELPDDSEDGGESSEHDKQPHLVAAGAGEHAETTGNGAARTHSHAAH